MSDIRTRKVVSTKKSANVPGANGAALAELILKEAEEVGKFIESKRTSRKDKLLALTELDHDGIVKFLSTMDARRNEIAAEAKAAGFDKLYGDGGYLESFAVANSVYSEISLWQKLARAVDQAWKPDFKMEWRFISAAATSHGKAEGTPGRTSNGRGGKPRGAPKTTPQAKAVKAARAALKDDKGVTLPVNNRNLADVVRGILSDATVEELDEVLNVVANMRETALKVREDAGKATAKASSSSKAQTTSNGATVLRSTAARKGSPAPTAGSESGPSKADALIEEGKAITASTGRRQRAKA